VTGIFWAIQALVVPVIAVVLAGFLFRLGWKLADAVVGQK